MFAPFSAFRKPEILDKEKHREFRIKKPDNFLFSHKVEAVPLGYSELLPVSMYYPVIFAVIEKTIIPFAILGINGRNVYLREDGSFKIEVIPRALKEYPLGVVKKVSEEGEEWLVIVDEACGDLDGEPLFVGDEESSFLKEQKQSLTELAKDFEEALLFVKELVDLNLFELLPEFKINTKWGEAILKNILIIDVNNLRKLSPEKLYYLNVRGYMAVLYSVYLSVRNFVFFDLIG